MKIPGLFYFIVSAFLLYACNSSQLVVHQSVGTKIALRAGVEEDPAINAMILPYKNSIDSVMNEVIGFAPQPLRAYQPESPLSNYCADIYRHAASAFLKRQVDVAVINMGGLRTSIPAGQVTVRNMYELMPFENELVVVWLRGNELIALLDRIASTGGEGISGLSFIIKDKKADKILIAGEPVNPDFTYSIATNNYLAEGNDNMHEMTQFDSKVKTGIKVRSMLIDFIKAATLAGKNIESDIQNRITKQ